MGEPDTASSAAATPEKAGGRRGAQPHPRRQPFKTAGGVALAGLVPMASTDAQPAARRVRRENLVPATPRHVSGTADRSLLVSPRHTHQRRLCDPKSLGQRRLDEAVLVCRLELANCVSSLSGPLAGRRG